MTPQNTTADELWRAIHDALGIEEQASVADLLAHVRRMREIAEGQGE